MEHYIYLIAKAYFWTFVIIQIYSIIANYNTSNDPNTKHLYQDYRYERIRKYGMETAVMPTHLAVWFLFVLSIIIYFNLTA